MIYYVIVSLNYVLRVNQLTGVPHGFCMDDLFLLNTLHKVEEPNSQAFAIEEVDFWEFTMI